jgi:N-methylhydantoinase A
VYFDGEWRETPIYIRGRLHPGNDIPGPAIVIQVDTTTVIEPRYKGSVDSYGNILIEEA